MARSKKVDSLIAKKREISKEIENLQNNCKHPKKSIRSTKEYEASSTFVIRRVCEDCNNIVGIPTHQEIFEFLNGTR